MHLGLPNALESLPREKRLVEWLESVRHDAAEIFLVGDIFDFWYEYKRIVPKGFTRFLGKVAEIVDSGIPVHFFTGNHDIWMYDYFPSELGVTLHTHEIMREWDGKKFFIAHGDGLGPGDFGYKTLKWIFTNKSLQWLFSRLHPNFSLWLGNSWSVSSRYSKNISHQFRGEDELITKFTRLELQQRHFDHFVFGHWHSPIVYELQPNSHLTVLGDWIVNFTYAVWDGEHMSLMRHVPGGPDELLYAAK